ncbi:lysozyme inhibitor LprI family protein [Methylorubrum sp. POS3]|uniref:lysozyme inhibitor LprI family protein n=1 Tax=Methylorubrum sp. POS3 TaxID=2998492 RepID=UPI0037290F8A
MKLVVWLLILAGLSSGVLAAEEDWMRSEPNAQELAAIESCLKKEIGVVKRRRCIGLVVDPCRATQDGATTLGRNACIGREGGIWDTILNRQYRQLSAALDDEGRADLKKAQQAWLHFRKHACGWSYHVYRGGSFGGALSGECDMDKIAIRAIDLMEIFDNIQ